MSNWGRRDREPPAEETELPAEETELPAEGTNESQAEAHDTREPAPAFWRAQGEMSGRDPADATPPDYGHVPPGGRAASAHGEQASGEAPAPAMNEAPAGTDAPVPVLTGVVIDAEATEVQETAVAVAREPAVDEAQEPAVTEPPGEAQEPPMTEAEQPAVSAVTPQRWSEILVAFVDDPRGSVKMAADAVDEAIDEFVNSVRARQHDLAATWQGAGADTEQLRTALREYRRLGRRVQQLDLG